MAYIGIWFLSLRKSFPISQGIVWDCFLGYIQSYDSPLETNKTSKRANLGSTFKRHIFSFSFNKYWQRVPQELSWSFWYISSRLNYLFFDGIQVAYSLQPINWEKNISLAAEANSRKQNVNVFSTCGIFIKEKRQDIKYTW